MFNHVYIVFGHSTIHLKFIDPNFLVNSRVQLYPASTVVGARPLNPTRRQNNWQKSPRRVRRYNLPDGDFPKIGHFQTSFPAVPVGLGSFLWLHTTKQDT